MVGKQVFRNNVVSDTPEDYWRRVVFLPFIDWLKKQLSDRFQGKVTSTIKAVTIIPNNLEQCTVDNEALVLECHNEDLPSPSTFQQELKLWKRYWVNEIEKLKSLSQTLSVISEKQIWKIFPNAMRVSEMLLAIPTTTASVGRLNWALRYI